MSTPPGIPAPLKRAADALRTAALAYPEASEYFPWGEHAFKVRGKVFLFMRLRADELSLSLKLPSSHSVALMFPFASPTGYGLASSGWVSSRFGPKDRVPVDTLRLWLEESYVAVAPRKLSAAIAGEDAPAARGAVRRAGPPNRPGARAGRKRTSRIRT